MKHQYIFYYTTQHHISEDCSLHCQCRLNMSHNFTNQNILEITTTHCIITQKSAVLIYSLLAAT